MTIHTLSGALFAFRVDMLFLLSNKFGFLLLSLPSLREGNVLFTGQGLPRSCSGTHDGSGGGRDEEAVQSVSPSLQHTDTSQKTA